jgi:hypothetical protein
MTVRLILRIFRFGLKNGKMIEPFSLVADLRRRFLQSFWHTGDPHLDDPCYSVTENHRDAHRASGLAFLTSSFVAGNSDRNPISNRVEIGDNPIGTRQFVKNGQPDFFTLDAPLDGIGESVYSPIQHR